MHTPSHSNSKLVYCISSIFFHLSFFAFKLWPGVKVLVVFKMKKSHSDTSKLDRKTVERNRRVHMKDLCFKLASLVPHHFSKHSKDMLSQQDQLELAACYIKQMRERVEKLKSVKEQAITTTRTSRSTGMASVMIGLRLPVVELRDFGSSIEVVLVSGLNKNFMFYEVITVLSEEGAEVVSASYSTVGDKVFHTIHAQSWRGDFKSVGEIARTDFLRVCVPDGKPATEK